MKFIGIALSALVVVAALAISPALASPTACPEHFAEGQAPDLINQKLAAKT